MDFSRLAWPRVDRLYDQVFFLGRLHFRASYSVWELGMKQGNIYFLREDDLLTVFFPGDKYKPSSNYRHRSMENLPPPFSGTHNVLTKACGFTIEVCDRLTVYISKHPLSVIWLPIYDAVLSSFTN